MFVVHEGLHVSHTRAEHILAQAIAQSSATAVVGQEGKACTCLNVRGLNMFLRKPSRRYTGAHGGATEPETTSNSPHGARE